MFKVQSKHIICSLLIPFLLGTTSAFSADESLRSDLDEAMTKAYQNKIQWDGDYTGFADSYAEENLISKTKDDRWGVLRHRLRLSMKAEPNEFFRFSGRLAAYKNMPVLETYESLTPTGTLGVVPDTTYSTFRPTSDAHLRIDRLYMDFFPGAKWLSFSFGIFPNTEGLPSDLTRVQPRKSTYPNMLFNRAFSAAVVALHPSQLVEAIPELHFWYIYSHGYDPAVTNQLGYNVREATQFTVKNRGHLHVFVSEFSPKVNFAEKFTVSAGYATIVDYTLRKDAYVLGALRSYGVEAKENLDIGNIDRLAVHMQVEHIARTGLNLYLGFATTPLQSGEFHEFGNKSRLGLFGTIHGDNRWGKAVLAGLTYDFNRINSWLGAPSIGYDLYAADKNYFGQYTSADEVTSRLDLLGVSHKFFYTQPITEDIRFHLSYILIKEKYNSSLVEIYVPSTVPGSPLVDVNGVSRGGRNLHAIQASFTVGF